MYDKCQEENVKCYFVSNLYLPMTRTQHDRNNIDDGDVRTYESAAKSFPDRYRPINGVPLENQWWENTPSQFHEFDLYKADVTKLDGESYNHLNLVGNRICGTILYEKLKQVGWNEK